MLEPDGTYDSPPSPNLLLYRWENRQRDKETVSEAQSGSEFRLPLSTALLPVWSSSPGGVQMTSSSPDVIPDFLKTNFLLKSLCSLIFLPKHMALKNYLCFFSFLFYLRHILRLHVIETWRILIEFHFLRRSLISESRCGVESLLDSF